MSAAQHDLEHIVREVLRRLREPETTQENHSATNSNGAVLRISHRLITLATLDGQLAGVERVVARPGAVVTPAVRDELRARNIELTVGEPQAADTSAAMKLLVVVAVNGYDPASLAGRLVKTGIQIEQIIATDWKQAVRKMTNQLTDSSHGGVILTDRPAAAVCLANRTPAIRAAVATDAKSAVKAVETMGANLLAVDPAAHSLQTLENLLREYARQGQVICPDEFQGV